MATSRSDRGVDPAVDPAAAEPFGAAEDYAAALAEVRGDATIAHKLVEAVSEH
jgi:hypothetical protein